VSAPDYISPIVAYRVWQWDAVGLKSLNNEQWQPDEALQARCRRRVSGVFLTHEAPGDGCSCGVYAAKDLAHLRNIGYADYGVCGEVYLWGTVVQHALGYRAQYAYPKSIVLPPDTVPFKMSEVESRLQTLMAYGADISIAGRRGGLAGAGGDVRLWSKESEGDMAGFDWLIEQRKKWYELRAQERTLKAGDRVAVLGKGIGVVASADSDEVHVRMWNKLTLRMPRKNIVWDRQNYRWESDGAETFARMSWPMPSADCPTATA
jgi:hypothetical protein